MSLFKRFRQAISSSASASAPNHSNTQEQMSERSLNIYIEAASERLRVFHGEVQRIEAECVSLRHKLHDSDDFIQHYHELAKQAMLAGDEDDAKRQLELERNERDRHGGIQRQLAESEQAAKTMGSQYEKLCRRLDSAKQVRESLLSRLQRAETQMEAFEMLRDVDIQNPLRDFEQLEREVMRQEARAEAEAEVYNTERDSLSESIAALKREMEAAD